ncbi:MAG: RNA-guided endonuclease TnpB family protein, partial [Clostridium perfringens]|nr:RNA-guided endonuclease TnpB family protein [Clostridium perfringens]
CKILNPRISFDGIKFWISVTCVLEHRQKRLPKTEAIGIDMGIKTLMVCSNGMSFKRVNTKKEKKKLKRLQKRASKFYENMKINKSYEKSKNLLKLETLILKQHQRISNVRLNNIHQATTKLIKLNPKAIVIEDLNVKSMMSNKHLSEKIADCSFYEIRRQLEYKSKWNDIEFIVADRRFPSSKTCSYCGYKKPKLSLSERTFKCECCKKELDRDYNASLNLKDLAM